MDDVEQLRELTVRGMQCLPCIEYHPGISWGPDDWCVEVKIPVPIDNPVFDGLYTCIVVFTDSGMFRVGEVRSGLVPRPLSLDDCREIVHRWMLEGMDDKGPPHPHDLN